MAHLVAVLEHVAATTGASVLYLHHVSKGSAREGQTDQQQAARGASALIDNARWCGYVARMTEDEAKRLSDRTHDRQPIVGFEPLGADDMRLLQGLVALGGPKGIILTPEPSGDLSKQLRLLLEPKFDAAGEDALVVRESMTSLLGEIGLTDGGDNIRAIKACLLRMTNVTVMVTKGIRHKSFHLMSHDFDEEDGRLFVALNPQITEAILGRRPHTRIDMAEVRSLQTDPALQVNVAKEGRRLPRSASKALEALVG